MYENALCLHLFFFFFFFCATQCSGPLRLCLTGDVRACLRAYEAVGAIGKRRTTLLIPDRKLLV